jgi:hypothetical protein
MRTADQDTLQMMSSTSSLNSLARLLIRDLHSRHVKRLTQFIHVHFPVRLQHLNVPLSLYTTLKQEGTHFIQSMQLYELRPEEALGLLRLERGSYYVLERGSTSTTSSSPESH